MSEVGKIFVIAGLMLAAIGALLWSGLGKDWIERLPGDIHYKNLKGSLSFYFPFATCLLISVILAIVLWLFRKWPSCYNSRLANLNSHF